MRSLDPMRNFPELEVLPAAEAKALVVKTQRQVMRQPLILIGLLATLAVAGVLIFNFMPVGGLLGGALIGALIGLAAVLYMVAVIKPRMRAEFRRQGYPRR
jgi:hypothetical protein